MADLFKIPIVEYWLDPGTDESRRVSKDTPEAVAVRKKSKNWYARIGGRRVALSADKEAARIMLGEKTRRAALQQAGAIDPFEAHHKRPLLEHLADWETALRSSGATEKHVRQTAACARRVIVGCKFRVIGELSASRVQSFIAELRKTSRRPPGPIDVRQASFTKAELAGLLGIKPAAVAALVRRHRLPAENNGPRRWYPRSTAEALLVMRSRGRSIKTANLHLDAVKAFAGWLVQDRRTGDNPLVHLTGGNVKLDRRHDRRDLDADELRRLLAIAAASPDTFRDLDGSDRYHLYATACGTGFRAGGLASLTPASFDLDTDTPKVTLSAVANKSRKTKEQPLPSDVAELLRAYLSDRPLNTPIWPGGWVDNAAEMLRRDLDAAGIPYIVDGPDGPLFADFHALRHSYLTLGGRAGIDLRTLQELAGHSTPALTARYSHRDFYDLDGAVGKLPNLLPDRLGAPAGRLSATGTDGARLRSACASGGIGGLSPGFVGTEGVNGDDTGAATQRQRLQLIGTGDDSQNPVGTNSPRRTRTSNKPVNSRLLYH
jgi:integrase